MLLSVKNLKVHYGVINAIKDISFDVEEGEIVALIGANGAGKTSTLHAISSLLTSKEGEITQVPEGRRVFAQLSVKDNLEMGAFLRNDNKVQSDMHRMYELFPRLAERKHQLAGTLSGGEQQMLAMARALMNKPKLLLLDEPSMGLSPILVNEIFDIIKTINKEEGVTVLLVEQNASKALSIANKAYVLETGKITIGGNAKEVANNPKVREAYLG